MIRKLFTRFTGLGLIWQVASGLALLALLSGVYWAVFIRPDQLKADAAQAKAETTVAKGEAAKAADAARIVENTHEILRTIERTTITNERQIRAADGAEQPMAPDVVRAGRAALCLRHAYKLHPACNQLPDADSAGVAGTDAGRQPAAG